MRARLLVASVVTMLAAGCSDSSRPPSAAPPAPGGDTISGRERFAWNQDAASPAELATYRYAVYVDGVRRILEDEVCAPVAGPEGFPCSAPLPPLTAGRHTIELAAFVTVDGTVLESSRSEPLHVTVAAAAADAGTPPRDPGPLVSSDGIPLDPSILSHSLDDPVDIAAGTDGRVFVAERARRLRMFDAAGRESTSDVPAPRGADSADLLSLALSPEFLTDGRVFLALRTATGGKHTLRILRARTAPGGLAESAEIASHTVAPDTTAVIRFGPDGRLYAGIGATPDGADAQTLSAATGKVLRLTSDGFTPDDNPWASPVWSTGHADLRGLAWHPGDGALWQLERSGRDAELNVVRRGANYGWPLVRAREEHANVTRPVFILPSDLEPSGLTIVANPASPLFGDLIVAVPGGQDLLRIRVGEGRRHRATSRLLLGRFGRIGGVTSSSDGALLAFTNNDGAGTAAGLLVRVTPARADRERGKR